MLLETKLCIFGLCTIFSMVMPEVIAMKEREGISFPSALLRQFIDFRKSGEDEGLTMFKVEDITHFKINDIDNRKRLLLYNWRKK